MAMPETAPAPWTAASPAEIVAAAGAEDLFVLRRVGGDRFAHLGGAGRGAGWAGIVEIAEQELLDAIAGGNGVVRRSSPEPEHIFGPYYARFAAIVGVSHDVVVVFGSTENIAVPDADLVELGRFVSEGVVEVGPRSVSQMSSKS